MIETGHPPQPRQNKNLECCGGETSRVRRSSADRGNVRPNSHGVARFRSAGMKILGTPLGHPDFVRASLESKNASHQRFLDRIPLLQDVQASWLLLVHCAAARANYMTRVVEPGATQEFSTRNDAALWNCLCQIMQIPTTQLDDVRETASTPMKLGGLGLRSARRISEAAYWASWADSLPMIQQRGPVVRTTAHHIPQSSVRGSNPFGASRVRTWDALALDARPPPREPEDVEPGGVRRGWQHSAASEVEKCARDEWFMRATDQVRALVRSQGGPGAGAALTAVPTGRETTIPSHLFRVILTGRACRCGRLLDAFGHHHAACARTGVLGRRGFALESAAARGRGPSSRRLEVVVDGLPLHGGAQLAVHTGQHFTWQRTTKDGRR